MGSAGGGRCAGGEGYGGEEGRGERDAPASSIFLMISTLYTLLAHFRSLGRLGTFSSTSSYFTAKTKNGGKSQFEDH